jgi:hypothetical protein
MTRSTTLLIALSLVTGCASETGSPRDGVLVAEGKADDFLSATATEYVVAGRATVTLEETYRDADEDARMARLTELVGYERVLISWFLTQYFIDKKHDDSNADYGGFGAMAKANTFDELDLRQEDDLTYSFAVRQLIAGPRDLLQDLPTTINDEGQREFALIVGNPSNEDKAKLETNHEWYRDAPWTSFNPDTLDDSQKKELVLTIDYEVESQDAWFDYQELFADDALTIDVHFGWDYHNAYHVTHARSTFSFLEREGFTPPVATFDELTRESGPFTRTLRADGREITVEVRLFYGKTGADTDPDTDAGGIVMENDMRESLRTRDVIVYSGHSGPFYGFALANWRRTEEGDLDDSEMSSVEMPADRYQVVFAEGCDTYHIGEAFRGNPAKPGGQNLDIITTTAPSDASSPAAVTDIISRLTEENDAGEHRPRTMMSLITDLDSNSYWQRPMYGIHGIDDNPQVHPYARQSLMCSECATDADCGGVGNRCYGDGAGARFCGTACTTDAGCGDGYRCGEIASANSMTIYDSVCVPAGGGC